MTRKQISPPVGVSGDPGGLDGYAATARRCEERILLVRRALDSSLEAVEHAAVNGKGVEAAADDALRLTLELEALERVQPRVDAWLRLARRAFDDDLGLAPFGDGPA